MTDSDLRALAEAVIKASNAMEDALATNTLIPLSAKERALIVAIDKANDPYIVAVSPEVVISLLDRLAAAERVVEAAREYRDRADHRDSLYSALIPPEVREAAELKADRAYDEMVAALDGEGKGPQPPHIYSDAEIEANEMQTQSIADDLAEHGGHGWRWSQGDANDAH